MFELAARGVWDLDQSLDGGGYAWARAIVTTYAIYIAVTQLVAMVIFVYWVVKTINLSSFKHYAQKQAFKKIKRLAMYVTYLLALTTMLTCACL